MIDWEQLKKNFVSKRLGMTQVANAVGIPAAQLQPLWKGEALEPPFSVGVKLLDFHLDRCPELHDRLLEI